MLQAAAAALADVKNSGTASAISARVDLISQQLRQVEEQLAQQGGTASLRSIERSLATAEKARTEAEAALLGDAWHPRSPAQAMKPQSSLNSAAQPKSKVALPAVEVKDRPCYMNSLMTESFFTMLLPKKEEQRVMPDSLGKQAMRRKFYRDFDL